MPINLDKPYLWKSDINRSVDFYNSWFMDFAPKAFREMRLLATENIQQALKKTNFLSNISSPVLEQNPEVLPILRMSTCPPIARERLVGLAGVPRTLVENMESQAEPHISFRMGTTRALSELQKIADVLNKMLDTDIFPWIPEKRAPEETEILRSSTIIADRLCGALTDPIIRNAQKKRQLFKIADFLGSKGYTLAARGTLYDKMSPGTFSFHLKVPVRIAKNSSETVNIAVDAAIMPSTAKEGDVPLFIEAKSAGDFTNVNKRRKEEAIKMQQLKNTFGSGVSYTLFLCGYFDSGYLAYEASEGIDWVWEHRISNLQKLGI